MKSKLQNTRRERTKLRFDRQLLRAHRDSRTAHDIKCTQEDMAELVGISLSTYKKAEAGECVDESIALKIMARLKKDRADLGLSPCNAPPAADPTKYLDDMHKECSYIDVRGLIVGSGKAPRLPIDKVYIPLRSARGGDQRALSAETGSDEAPILEQTMETHQRLVVIGDPGGGKSTFLRRLAHRQSGRNATHFPVMIRIFALEAFIFKRVRGGSSDTPEPDSADWIPRFLEDRSDEFGWGLDAAFFRGKLREPSTVIMLDGLDEVPNPARRNAIARLFERATKAYREARFVVTTRPVSYEGKGTLDGFEAVRIGDLEQDAVEDFLRHWSGFLFSENKAAADAHNRDLLRARRERPEIRRMTRNPLMLTALAVIQWNERKLPEQRADLFESILKWLSEAHEYLNRRQGHECLAIFGVLALGMQCYPGGRIKNIEKAEAARLIKDEFRDEPEERREAAALEFLESELVNSGIVLSRGDSLEFWHLTFQEYLAARACNDLDAVALLFEDERWSKQEWREVMLLVTGVLIRNGKKRVDGIFNKALERGEKGVLAVKARAAGLLGTALLDLRPSNYRPPDEARYEALLTETLGIFDVKKAVGIDVQVRREAAEALGQAGDPRLSGDGLEKNWIALPGGTFLMGAQAKHKGKPGYDAEAFDNDGPVREETVGPFSIGKYPVTVEEFRRFVEDEEGGYAREQFWRAGGYQKEKVEVAPPDWDELVLHPNRPVVNVNWYAASAYCAWASARTGTVIRLPQETEWEFAARGTEGRKYPWGWDEPKTNRANYDATNAGGVTPVGLFPAGNTPDPEGIADLAGNVWEWTGSDYNEDRKVVRGASYIDDARRLRAAFRGRGGPGGRSGSMGFRCVRE